MTFYSTAVRKSSPHKIRDAGDRRQRKQRDRFARAARNRAFRAWDLSLAREPGFVDRQPDQPIRLGIVVNAVVDYLGQRALQHWLCQAAEAEGEEREAALEAAKEIAAMIGVPWADVMSRAA